MKVGTGRTGDAAGAPARWASTARRLGEASSVFLIGVLLAVTFQLAYHALRTVIALPRTTGLPRLRTRAGARVTAPAAMREAAAPEAIADARPVHTGAFAAWHYRPFVLYYCGLVFGVTGYFMYYTAQGWLALQLTDSPAGISLLFTVSSLPMLFLTLFGGAVADRFHRRLIVIITRLFVAGITVTMGLATIGGEMTIPVFVVLSLALGVVWSFDLPTRQALTADLIPPAAMGNAYAWQSVLQFSGSTIGPIVAGLIVVRAGPGPALVVGGLGHVVLSTILLTVRTTQRRALGESVGRRVLGGLTFLWRNEAVLLLIILATIPPLTVWAINPLLPIVARDILHGDAGTYGWLTGAIGIGSILGAVFVAVAHRIRWKGWLSVLGTILGGLFLMGLAYTDRLPLALLFLLLNGAVSGVAATLTAALVQVLTPPDYQGRVASIYMMTWNVMPLGVMLFGAVAQASGVPFAIWAAGLSSITITLLLAVVRPTLRRLQA